MNNAMKMANLPKLIFDFDEFTFFTIINDANTIKKVKKSSEKIIDLMKKQKHITISELAENVGISTRAIEKQISKLKENKTIKRIGADKGGYWEVR